VLTLFAFGTAKLIANDEFTGRRPCSTRLQEGMFRRGGQFFAVDGQLDQHFMHIGVRVGDGVVTRPKPTKKLP